MRSPESLEIDRLYYDTRPLAGYSCFIPLIFLGKEDENTFKFTLPGDDGQKVIQTLSADYVALYIEEKPIMAC